MARFVWIRTSLAPRRTLVLLNHMENDQPELSPSVKLGLWGGAWALSALCLLLGLAFAVIALGVAGVS